MHVKSDFRFYVACHLQPISNILDWLQNATTMESAPMVFDMAVVLETDLGYDNDLIGEEAGTVREE